VTTSGEGEFSFTLGDLPVAEFYRRLFDRLRSLGIAAAINTKPFGLDDEHTLEDNTFHHVCDREYFSFAHRWRCSTRGATTWGGLTKATCGGVTAPSSTSWWTAATY
jgi:spermidine synthase